MQVTDNISAQQPSQNSDFEFSFIMPVYNTERYLQEAIDSIFNQTIGFKDHVQLVLVDDGSTDRSPAICKAAYDRFPENVVYIRTENRGVSSARNTGLQNATGTYINFIDSDDLWSSNVCSVAHEFFFNSRDVKVASFGIRYFGRFEREHALNFKFKRSKVASVFTDPDFVLYHAVSCFIRADCARRHAFDPEAAISEDFLWIGKILLDVQEFGVLKGAEYLYRKRDELDSAIDGSKNNLDYYFMTPRVSYQGLLDYSKQVYGRALPWAQNVVMFDMGWRIRDTEENVLNEEQAAEYLVILTDLLKQIDDEAIVQTTNLWSEGKIYSLGLKRNMSYDEARNYVHVHGDNVCFVTEDGNPLRLKPFSSSTAINVEQISLKKESILISGTVGALLPTKRIDLTFEVASTGKQTRIIHAELLETPDCYSSLCLEQSVPAKARFAVELALNDLPIEIRAFAILDGRRRYSELKYLETAPFTSEQEVAYFTDGKHIVRKLGKSNRGIAVEKYSRKRDRELKKAQM